MKLTKVKVENYRSVEDSQKFKIDDAITCLVGKNEGKTTLLTALYRLNPIFDADAKYDKTRDYVAISPTTTSDMEIST
jgi:predicted ATP-dependent endonuclease of OLD family